MGPRLRLGPWWRRRRAGLSMSRKGSLTFFVGVVAIGCFIAASSIFYRAHVDSIVTLRIDGRVIDASRRPIADAAVYFMDLGFDDVSGRRGARLVGFSRGDGEIHLKYSYKYGYSYFLVRPKLRGTFKILTRAPGAVEISREFRLAELAKIGKAYQVSLYVTLPQRPSPLSTKEGPHWSHRPYD
jgi:hypothetical protein